MCEGNGLRPSVRPNNPARGQAREGGIFKNGKQFRPASSTYHFSPGPRMKWTVLLLALVCCTNASQHDSKRLGQVEDAVQYLIREVKELKVALSRQERSSESTRSQEETRLAHDTLTALQAESRALSQFDVQMRNLQNSLDQLSRNKYQQTQTVETFRHELQSLR